MAGPCARQPHPSSAPKRAHNEGGRLRGGRAPTVRPRMHAIEPQCCAPWGPPRRAPPAWIVNSSESRLDARFLPAVPHRHELLPRAVRLAHTGGQRPVVVALELNHILIPFRKSTRQAASPAIGAASQALHSSCPRPARYLSPADSSVASSNETFPAPHYRFPAIVHRLNRPENCRPSTSFERRS